MFRPTAPLLFVASLAILLAADESRAQGRSTGGIGGSSATAFGSGGSFGGSSFGGSSFGTSSGLGASSFGSSSFGGSSFGGSTAGGGGTAFGSATAGQNTQSFVGRNAAGIESFFGAATQAFEGYQRQQRASQGASSGSGTIRRPEVRVTLSAAQELQRATAAARPTATTSLSNVSRLLAKKGLEAVSLSAEAGVARLEGVVASESDRLLAEKLASIEPGVRRVDNRLEIAPGVEELPAPAN